MKTSIKEITMLKKFAIVEHRARFEYFVHSEYDTLREAVRAYAESEMMMDEEIGFAEYMIVENSEGGVVVVEGGIYAIQDDEIDLLPADTEEDN